MKKLTTRQKQAIDTKQRIINIATKLFKDKGFDKVKIQDICQEANISVGAFYHHFKSKTDIITTGYKEIDDILRERFQSKIFESDIEKIQCLLEEGGELLEEFGYELVSYLYQNLLSVKVKYSLNEKRFEYIEIKSSIESAIKKGELKAETSSNELLNTIMRVIRGAIFDWCLYEGGFSLKDLIIHDYKLIINNYVK